jgi:hypothetical protein
MNANLKTILVTTAALFSLSAMAADPVDAPPPLTKHEAKDLKTESKADYKARKNITEAQKELDVADCKTSGLESKDERDCKKMAKDSAKDSKHTAKEIYKQEKADIKAQTK